MNKPTENKTIGDIRIGHWFRSTIFGDMRLVRLEDGKAVCEGTDEKEYIHSLSDEAVPIKRLDTVA